jgi:hypothetical protein
MVVQKQFPTLDIDFLQATLKAHNNNVDDTVVYLTRHLAQKTPEQGPKQETVETINETQVTAPTEDITKAETKEEEEDDDRYTGLA